MKKLNIVCGSETVEGWINIDKCGGNLVANVYEGLSFKDNVIDIIFSCHLLEHLTCEEAKKFLMECKRVLKPDGIIRTVVPDLEICAKKYLERDLSFYNEPGPYDGQRYKGDTIADKFAFIAYQDGLHKYFYDFHSLKNLLEKCGFKRIRKCQYRESDIVEIETLDNRPFQSLFVEARG